MNDMIDLGISRLLAEGAPPARDPAFDVAVMARIAQRRFHRALALNAALALAVSLLLVLTMPMLGGVWSALSSNLVIAGLLLAGGFVVLQSPLARDD